MVSTAPYQRGAVAFAKAHGVALATVTEGRFTYETRDASQSQPISRAAAKRLGITTFVGHHYGPGEQHGSTSVTLVSAEYPNYIADLLLARPSISTRTTEPSR